MPNRDVVRSLSLPKNGLASRATMAPTPATRLSAPARVSGVVISETLMASTTRAGASTAIHRPALAMGMPMT